jgi:acetyl-CoA C-acetyltransferase
MAKRVAICAVAQTPFEPNTWHKRFQEMAFDVVEPILKSTGVTFDEKTGIDTMVTCSDDVFDARTISDNAMTDAVGAHFRCEEKIAQDGVNAIAYGMACILSGHTDLVLVVGHCKESQSESRNMCTNLAYDPFYCRPVGLDFLNVSALQARAYLARSGVTERHLAEVVVHARRNAARNPLANARKPVSTDEVLNSPMLCDPIRQLHAYPVSDGAIAMLLASDKRAAEFTDKPVWVAGFGNCMDSYFPGDRDLADNFALKRAAERAYKMAKVKSPAKAFDVIEVNDCYAYQLPMWIEGLGICPDGKAGAWIEGSGLDKHNVNTSGGMLAGNPVMIGGLARAAEAVLQLRGEAGDRQVEGARKALAHGTTGGAGQHHSVLILEKKA